MKTLQQNHLEGKNPQMFHFKNYFFYFFLYNAGD